MKDNIINDDIDYIAKLVVQLLKTPVYFLDSSCNVVVNYNYGTHDSIFQRNKSELFNQLFDSSNLSTIPTTKSTEYYENYLSVKLVKDGFFKGIFVIGPSIYPSMNDEKVSYLMEEHNIPISQKKLISDYYSSLAVIEYNRLIGSGLALHYMIYNKKLDIKEVMMKSSYLDKVMMDVDHNFKINLSQNKQNIHFHHSRAFERNLYNCIKNGDSQSLLTLMQNPQDGELGVLSKKNHLRNQKNLAICMITISTRAAMEGGLDSESAYTLSDIYIQNIEEMENIGDINTFMIKIACDFANRVHKAYQNKYSPNVRKCITYISKHLYEDINLLILAELVKLNPNYLSELLKKELGIPFALYVQRERIEEAKRLLTFSSYSLTEIATWLNFHDQSHFTRVFKKHACITPKKYRDENIIIST
jgi:YesN/AraC family two-component response regulator